MTNLILPRRQFLAGLAAAFAAPAIVRASSLMKVKALVLPETGAFTAAWSGTTLAVVGIMSGQLGIGDVITGCGIPALKIIGQASGATGGLGTYIVDMSGSSTFHTMLKG